jgi:hypothetical protein
MRQQKDFEVIIIGGIYASGDSTIQARSVAMAVSSGSFAGTSINKGLIDESFI